jgi:hypothetical protein
MVRSDHCTHRSILSLQVLANQIETAFVVGKLDDYESRKFLRSLDLAGFDRHHLSNSSFDEQRL